MPLDKITALAFSLRSAPGAYAVLVGSGVSSAAGIPTGWAIVLDLIRRIAAAQGADAGAEPERWYAAEFGEEPRYSTLLDLLAKTQAERQALLRGYIEPTDDDRKNGLKVPTNAHRMLADLVARGYIKVVITTNFDRLIEQALEQRGVAYDVIDGVDALLGVPPIGLSSCLIVKLHGDYRDARIRNTPTELANYEPEISALLDRLLDEHGLIVCGWSATWDTALRSAITRQPNRRFTTFWSARGAVSDAARELITARRAEVIEGYDAERLFTQLESKVAALELVDRPHPLSVTTAVAELKRYLPDPQARIRLEDLLLGEADRVVEATKPELFPASGPRDIADVRQRVVRYDAAVEVMIALLAFGCSHSAGPEQDRLFSRAIERIAENNVKNEAGLVGLIALRRYPAMMCLYAAGMAAFASESWATLHELLIGRETLDPSDRPVPLIAGLCPWVVFRDLDAQALLHPEWTGGKLHTPISDHLHRSLRDVLRPIVSNDEKYDELFDRFELLLGLVLADLSAQKDRAGYVPDGYVGRFGWRRKHDHPDPVEWISKEIAKGSASSLLRSRLFGGDETRLTTALAEETGLLRQFSFF